MSPWSSVTIHITSYRHEFSEFNEAAGLERLLCQRRHDALSVIVAIAPAAAPAPIAGIVAF